MFRGVLDMMQMHSVGKPRRGSGELRMGACRASPQGGRSEVTHDAHIIPNLLVRVSSRIYEPHTQPSRATPDKVLFGSDLAVNDVAKGILGQDNLPASD